MKASIATSADNGMGNGYANEAISEVATVESVEENGRTENFGRKQGALVSVTSMARKTCILGIESPINGYRGHEAKEKLSCFEMLFVSPHLVIFAKI